MRQRRKHCYILLKETTTQLKEQRQSQELDIYTPLTKAALESYDLEATKHMDKRNLEKQKTIKEQRRTKELTALAAEAAGTSGDKIDDRILVSPLGINESQTAAVLTYTQELDVKAKEKEDGDEHINRLVQDVKEDTKSVWSFGKRTDVGANKQEEGQEKLGVGQIGPLKTAIRRYVGDY